MKIVGFVADGDSGLVTLSLEDCAIHSVERQAANKRAVTPAYIAASHTDTVMSSIPHVTPFPGHRPVFRSLQYGIFFGVLGMRLCHKSCEIVPSVDSVWQTIGY